MHLLCLLRYLPNQILKFGQSQYHLASSHTSYTGVSTLLTDTVGFITDLPHDLVASFRATLEEVVAADLLLLVRCVFWKTHRCQHIINAQPTRSIILLPPHTQTNSDASTIGTPLFEAQRASVYRVLNEIGTPRHLERSIVEVWNKVDALHGDVEREDALQRALFEARRAREQRARDDEGADDDDGNGGQLIPPLVVPVSARTGQGLAELKSVIAGRLVADGHVAPANWPTSSEEP